MLDVENKSFKFGLKRNTEGSYLKDFKTTYIEDKRGKIANLMSCKWLPLTWKTFSKDRFLKCCTQIF